MTSKTVILAALSACATSPRLQLSGDKPLLGTPPPEQGGTSPSPRRLRGIKDNENHSTQLEEHAVRMRALGVELGPEEQVASGKLRQIQEDIPLEPELPVELLVPPELPEMQAGC